jgi:aspartate ammonia-lyase
VSLAVAAGELELNVMEPVILDALLDIFRDLTIAASTLAARCIQDLVWDGARRSANLAHSLDELVGISQIEGYDQATRHAADQGRTPPS